MIWRDFDISSGVDLGLASSHQLWQTKKWDFELSRNLVSKTL